MPILWARSVVPLPPRPQVRNQYWWLLHGRRRVELAWSGHRVSCAEPPRKLLIPKPIGASAGRSTAPESATCKKSVSFDSLKLGLSTTTTPSSRCPAPKRLVLNRKSITRNCSAVVHFFLILPPS